MKSFVTYSEGYQPVSIKYKLYWLIGNLLGLSIIRVRSVKNRYGINTNKTFKAVHFGKHSFFKALKKPTKKLWFKKLVNIGETNRSMKILETPR